LDAHRKRQQAVHAGLTLTDVYNVLAKLSSGEVLTAKHRATYEQGLCSVLKQIHDDLDAAVFDAYGWPATLTDEEILERLVALNHERAEEEKRGFVRWLRPEFQAPAEAERVAEKWLVQPGDLLSAEECRSARRKQDELLAAADGFETADDEEETSVAAAPSGKEKKQPWPDSMSAQVQAVRSLLTASSSAASPESLARSFTGRKANQIRDILETLVVLGQARRVEGGYVA